ncbi:cyclase [Streptomyces sp. NPDC012746]|uniref:cyclase n=1 Tax=Streptomyces sp. NPDC012746 TaxID=3364845 RepID=UPI00367F71E3
MPESTLARLKNSPAADRAKEELERCLIAQAERLLVGAGRAMGRSTSYLNAMADGSSPGLKALALDSARKIGKGRGPVRAVVEAGAKQAKDKTVNAVRARLGRRGGKPGRGRPTVILESVDVGVPVEDAYNQWTRYRDFPDERIAWTSEGRKGTTRGVVTFHELAVDLTRVLMVVEYHPQGLREKTANLWRAQGRRVRLDLRNYARFLTLKEGRPDGRRGEIRDGELVEAHEEEPETADADAADDTEYEEAYEDEETDDDYDYDYEGEPEDEPEAPRTRGHAGSRRRA